MFIFLASQSSRRKAILKALRIPFKSVPSRYRENYQRCAPRKLALTHARGKAKQAVLPPSARYVLGSDTVVYAQRRILGKPKTLKQAAAMLKLISGRSHFVYTAIALWDREQDRFFTGVEKTQVDVKALSAGEIEEYIKKTRPYDKAGGYGIQKKPKIVTQIRGSYSNVVGLPKELLLKILKKVTSYQ